MKLGIVSCYFINNYGSILQAYALQEYLSAKGIECDTISVEGLKPYLDAKKSNTILEISTRQACFFQSFR